MMNNFKQDLEKFKRRIANKPHLRVVETNATYIPERLYEYDNSLFLVRNMIKNKFEIHTLDNKNTTTFAVSLADKELDVRILNRLMKNDNKKHGKKLFDDIDRANEEYENMLKLKRRNLAEDTALDFRSLAVDLANQMNI